MKPTSELLHAFDKAVQLKRGEADRCNQSAKEDNIKRARGGIEPLATDWCVWVWQNPSNPKGYTIILQPGQPKHEWAVTVEVARERLERTLEVSA